MRSALEEIKSRLDIVQVISEYLSLKKAGQNYKGLCPFHTEKTPSFMVSPSKQIYHCFGCGNGGDVFSFLVRYENLSFQEAVNVLAQKAGVTLKKSTRDTVKAGEIETLLNLHRDALVFYQKALSSSHEVMNYLKTRGINGEAQRLFKIGYAPQKRDALLSYLKNKGYELGEMKKAGLINQGVAGYYDTFRGRIILPIFDLRGNIIAFGGRVVSPQDEPKYLNSPETPIFNKSRVLYGLNLAKESIKKSGYVTFVEGYFDVITSHIFGFSNTVAPLGTALTDEHGKLIKRFVENVVLIFDGDPSGIKAAKNALRVLLESGLNVKVVPLPEGEDPDGFLRKNGKEAFNNLLDRALSIVDFFMMQKGDKHSIAHDALEIIAKIPDHILQGHYTRLLSEKLRINEVFFREELKKIKGAFRTKGGYTNIRKEVTGVRDSARHSHELYIILLLLRFLSSELYQPEKAERILNSLSIEDFDDPIIKSIFKKIKEGPRDFASLILKCDDGEKNLLTGLSFKKIDFEEPDKALEDCLKRLRSKRRQALLHELQDRIKEAELRNNRELLRTLQLEQQRLLGLNGR